MRILKKVIKILRSQNSDQSKYFDNDKIQIAATNLSLLRVISSINIILLILFILAAHLLIPGWTVTRYHMLAIPVFSFLALISETAYRKKVQSPRLITAACVVYSIVLVGFLIIIDVFPYPDRASTFTPLLLAVSPMVFIVPFFMVLPYMFGIEIIYFILVGCFKTGAVLYNDLFTSVVALILGLFMYQMTTEIRARDNNSKRNFKKLSRIDHLTGILNKYGFEESVKEYLKLKEFSEECAVFVLDLDNFKNINDTFGHVQGDKLLEAVGSTVAGLFRAGDFIGRFGGDEFVILMKDIRDYDIIEKKCDFLRTTIEALVVDEITIKTTVSIGVAVSQQTRADYEELLKLADDALYEAKACGKNRSEIYYYETENITQCRAYMKY